MTRQRFKEGNLYKALGPCLAYPKGYEREIFFSDLRGRVAIVPEDILMYVGSGVSEFSGNIRHYFLFEEKVVEIPDMQLERAKLKRLKKNP